MNSLSITSLNIIQRSGLIFQAFFLLITSFCYWTLDRTRRAGTSLEKTEDVLFAAGSLHPHTQLKRDKVHKPEQMLKHTQGKPKLLGRGRQSSIIFNCTFLLRFLIRVADIIPLVSLELIFFRVSVDPTGLVGPTLGEARCK